MITILVLLSFLVGGGISEPEQVAFSLPACKRELGVWNSVDSAQLVYSKSRSRTRKIVGAIKGEEDFSVDKHMELISSL